MKCRREKSRERERDVVTSCWSEVALTKRQLKSWNNGGKREKISNEVEVRKRMEIQTDKSGEHNQYHCQTTGIKSLLNGSIVNSTGQIVTWYT